MVSIVKVRLETWYHSERGGCDGVLGRVYFSWSIENPGSTVKLPSM